MFYRNNNYQPAWAGMKFILFAVFAAFFLAPAAVKAGDAAASKPASNAAAKKSVPANPDGRRTIGVVSEIGDSFSIRQIGVTVFDNEENIVPVDNWGLDALVAAKAGAILKARFNVIPIKLSKEGRAALAGAPSALSGPYSAAVRNISARCCVKKHSGKLRGGSAVTLASLRRGWLAGLP
jgi:hypothetical protein